MSIITSKDQVATGPDAEWESAQPQPPVLPSQGLTAACTTCALMLRLVAMFLKAEAGPVASAHGPAATKSSLGYTIAMDKAVRLFWQAHEPEVKRLCGPSMPLGLIDQQEVFGFALADGLDRPLIPYDRARGVGAAGDDAIRNARRAKPKAGKLRRAEEAKREAMRKATAAAEKDASLASDISDAERAGERGVAAVLAEHCNLKLPNETVGAKRTREPAAKVTSPPSLAALEMQVSEAEAEWDALRQKREALGDSLERAKRQLSPLQSEPGWDAFFDAEAAAAQADGSMNQIWEQGRWNEWYESLEARWFKTPVGCVQKKVDDLQRAFREAVWASADASLSLHELEQALQARRAAESVESEDGDSTEEESDQLVRMRPEIEQLQAENEMLRAALKRAHATNA